MEDGEQSLKYGYLGILAATPLLRNLEQLVINFHELVRLVEASAHDWTGSFWLGLVHSPPGLV